MYISKSNKLKISVVGIAVLSFLLVLYNISLRESKIRETVSDGKIESAEGYISAVLVGNAYVKFNVNDLVFRVKYNDSLCLSKTFLIQEGEHVRVDYVDISDLVSSDRYGLCVKAIIRSPAENVG